jgi:hypothetical protein
VFVCQEGIFLPLCFLSCIAELTDERMYGVVVVGKSEIGAIAPYPVLDGRWLVSLPSHSGLEA